MHAGMVFQTLRMTKYFLENSLLYDDELFLKEFIISFDKKFLLFFAKNLIRKKN